MQFISFLGTQYFQIILFAWLYWCIDQKTAIRLGMVLIAGNGFNAALKWIFHAPRPYWISTLVKPLSTESSFGMPSGHAMMSTIFYGRIAFWLKKKWFTVLILTLIFLIGFSRLYLGVHFFSDVIAGLAFGIGFLLVVARLEQPVSRWLNTFPLSSRIAIYFFSSVLFLLFFGSLKSSLGFWQIPDTWLRNVQEAGLTASIDPFRMKDIFTLSGLGFGMLTGYTWIIHTSNHQKPGGQMNVFLRLVIGFSGLAILMTFQSKMNEWMPGELIKLVFTYFEFSLISFWITGVAPSLFQKIENKRNK